MLSLYTNCSRIHVIIAHSVECLIAKQEVRGSIPEAGLILSEITEK